MDIFLITIGVTALLSLLYLNTVATIILFKAPGSAIVLNIIRSAFVWLIPVIGFAFTLRFTQQSYDCEMHYKLVPRFIRNWIYDSRLEPANPNADRNIGRAVMLGLADQINQIRSKF